MNVKAAIISRSVPRKGPDGRNYRALMSKDTAATAQDFRLKPREVERMALEAGIVPERYVRNFHAFSYKEQIRLLDSCVAVVGLGGLGGGVCEILARTGIGRLVIMDGDLFEEHNLNRQLGSTTRSISKPKAEVIADRIGRINPAVEVNIEKSFLTEKTPYHIFEHAQVIVDCLDNISGRFLLQSIARRLKIPLVSAAVAGTSGQVTVITPDGPGFERIYGKAQNRPERGVESSLGCLAHTVLMLSALECNEVFKIILDRGHKLTNRLLVVDLAENSFDLFGLGG